MVEILERQLLVPCKFQLEIPKIEGLLPRQGKSSLLYYLSDGNVGKFKKTKGWKSKIWKVDPFGNSVNYEAKIAEELFNAGIWVPEPHGVINLEQPRNESWSRLETTRSFPAFIMDYIQGVKDPSKIEPKSDEGKYVQLLIDKELEKAKKLGFRTHNTGYHNTLWVPEKERIYLIDFSSWKKR